MSIFICEKCGKLDNTACNNNYWHASMNKYRESKSGEMSICFKPEYSYFENHVARELHTVTVPELYTRETLTSRIRNTGQNMEKKNFLNGNRETMDQCWMQQNILNNRVLNCKSEFWMRSYRKLNNTEHM